MRLTIILSSKVIFYLKLKISITNETIKFLILRKLHIGHLTVYGYFFSQTLQDTKSRLKRIKSQFNLIIVLEA